MPCLTLPRNIYEYWENENDFLIGNRAKYSRSEIVHEINCHPLWKAKVTVKTPGHFVLGNWSYKKHQVQVAGKLVNANKGLNC